MFISHEWLSQAELSSLLGIIYDCLYCSSIERFQEIVNVVSGLLQSGNIVFLSSNFNFPSTPTAIHEINVSYPIEWTALYRTQNYVQVDPILNICRRGLLYWEHIYKEFPPDKGFYSQAKSFGLTNGFSHILADKKGFGLMSVADANLSNSERNRFIINNLAPHFHQLVAKLVHEKSCKKIPRLTPREREVLLWALEGKTNWEISIILGISQESIKGHVANILRKLEASNRAHAVAIALQHGLLSS